MNRIYEKLKNEEYFKDKMQLDEQKNCLTIIFHEYLRFEYFEGTYQGLHNQGALFLKGPKIVNIHYHIFSDEEALESIYEVTRGSNVYIENTSLFAHIPLKILSQEKFEKKKDKYMKKKSLCIYTVDSLIKRITK